MKKHILGFALFKLIVISFAVASAFFNVPPIPTLPKVEEARPPVIESNYRASCRKNRQSPARPISTEIITSNYFYDENKIVTRIRVTLDSAASALPDKIYVTASYSPAGEMKKDSFGDLQIFENPFVSGLTRELTIVTRVSGSEKIGADDNLYVLINVSDADNSGRYKSKDNITQAKEVLTVYGKTR